MIGAGHNGLTAAAYLGARRTVVPCPRTPRHRGRLLCDRRDRARLSRLHHLVHREHVAAARSFAISSWRITDCAWFPAIPSIQVPFPDGHVVPWWADRERALAEFRKYSRKGRRAHSFASTINSKSWRATCSRSFLEPPPELDTGSLCADGPIFSAWENASARFRTAKSRSWSPSSPEASGEFLDHNYESNIIKTLFLANNVYGKHGGPYQPGTAIGLLFHLLSGGEHELQGFYGHVMGGMGAITQALAAAGTKLGVEIRTSAHGRPDRHP